MTQISTQLAGFPEWFPHGLDLPNDTVSFLRMTETGYAEASFLDARAVPPGASLVTLPFAEVESAASGLTESCDFIFHIGHVGSPLLSRLLGRHPEILSLREPVLLRTLAGIQIEPSKAPN